MRKTWNNLLRRSDSAPTAAAAAAPRRKRTPVEPDPPRAPRHSSASSTALEDHLRARGDDGPAAGCRVNACSPVPGGPCGGEPRAPAASDPSSDCWAAASRCGEGLHARAERFVAERPSVRYAVSATSAAPEEDSGLGGGGPDVFSAVRRGATSTGAGARTRTSGSGSQSSGVPSVQEKCCRLLVKALSCSFSSSDLTRRFLHRNGPNRKETRAEDQAFGPTRPRGLVFGVRLTDLPRAATAIVAVGELGSCRVPVFLERCTRFLLENGTSITGTFRICGSLRRMAELQGRFDAPPTFGTDIDLSPGGEYTVHDVASAVRRYLNELPESVIPKDMYGVFRATYDEFRDDEDEQVARYKAHILNLPQAHRDVLAFITDALAAFALHAESTLMSVENLAAVFQPGLLNHPDHCADPGEYMRNQRIVATLVQRSGDLFRSPVRESERTLIDPPPVPMTIVESLNTTTARPRTTLRRKPATRQGRCRQGEAPKRGATLLPDKQRSSSKIVSLRRSATVNCVSFDSRTATDLPCEVSTRRSSCIDVRHAPDLFGTAMPKIVKVLDTSSPKECLQP